MNFCPDFKELELVILFNHSKELSQMLKICFDSHELELVV